MPELTLQRVEPGRYTLGELGTLRSGRRFGAKIEAEGTVWALRRGPLPTGGVITATDAATGTRQARYVPGGFLRLSGIYRGTIELGERELDWRADHRMGEHFTLRESGYVLAKLDAGTDAQPVSVALFGLHHLEALPLLFCCCIVKRVVDMTMAAGSPGAPVASPGG
ncbi:MAG TPA: hypothetical protein VG186_05470 [Solirubrobacteraceae bacterium]|nr:hypothetical protein [Solirubrobacteraceae bacterium]